MDDWIQRVEFSSGVLVVVALVGPRTIQWARCLDGQTDGSLLCRRRWLEAGKTLSPRCRTDNLAVSHAPSMFRGVEHWSVIHRVLTGNVPQPMEIEKETPAVLRNYIDRINSGFSALQRELERFKPDVLLVVGDDQAEVFTEAN